MSEVGVHIPGLVLLFGVIIVINILLRSFLQRIGFSALVGYILFGFALRMADNWFHFFDSAAHGIFEFLAGLGIIVLLFRIGLESNLQGLLRNLRRACLVWIGNIVVSGLTGFIIAYWLLHLSLVQSLFVGIALTATSVGVSVAIWRQERKLDSPAGQTLLDIAELDDISGIVLMAMLFTLAPVIHHGKTGNLLGAVFTTGTMMILKLLFFGAICFIFSVYAEKQVTTYLKRIESPPGYMLTLVGIGIIMAALAGLLGFSVAIGAFFAGLVFSRDPRAVRMQGSFEPLFELLSPFFFINIGLAVDPRGLVTAGSIGLVLLIVAIAGKVIGTGIPARLFTNWKCAGVLGMSMVPRAEITMIIMHRGVTLGDWAVPAPVFAGMVLVSLVTSTVFPLAVRNRLRSWSTVDRMEAP